MIETLTHHDSTQIILSPNRSMSWESNKKILIALFCLNASIAIAWTFMGAWMVLPFAGLEVFCVGLGMYYVSWKLNFKHIITFKEDALVLEKGVYFPKQEWRWLRSHTTLVKVPSRYRMSAPQLLLRCAGDNIEIGDFLNRDDKKRLLKIASEFELRVETQPATT